MSYHYRYFEDAERRKVFTPYGALTVLDDGRDNQELNLVFEEGDFTLPNGRQYFSTDVISWSVFYGFKKEYDNLSLHYKKSARTNSSKLKVEDEDAETISDCILQVYLEEGFGPIHADREVILEAQEVGKAYRNKVREAIAVVNDLNDFSKNPATEAARIRWGHFAKTTLRFK
jgi:hypothetical protein